MFRLYFIPNLMRYKLKFKEPTGLYFIQKIKAHLGVLLPFLMGKIQSQFFQIFFGDLRVGIKKHFYRIIICPFLFGINKLQSLDCVLNIIINYYKMQISIVSIN